MLLFEEVDDDEAEQPRPSFAAKRDNFLLLLLESSRSLRSKKTSRPCCLIESTMKINDARNHAALCQCGFSVVRYEAKQLRASIVSWSRRRRSTMKIKGAVTLRVFDRALRSEKTARLACCVALTMKIDDKDQR